MSRQSRPTSPKAGRTYPSPLKIRHATRDDVQSVADLIVRTKKLNNEFDPMFAVVGDLRRKAVTYATGTVGKPGKLMLVAVAGSKVVGVIRAEMRKRPFYEPSREGFITEFYILPEFRRKALGNEMLRLASSELKRIGAQIIVADVPSQNEIAVRFYGKRRFRSLNQFFAKSPQ